MCIRDRIDIEVIAREFGGMRYGPIGCRYRQAYRQNSLFEVLWKFNVDFGWLLSMSLWNVICRDRCWVLWVACFLLCQKLFVLLGGSESELGGGQVSAALGNLGVHLMEVEYSSVSVLVSYVCVRYCIGIHVSLLCFVYLSLIHI